MVVQRSVISVDALFTGFSTVSLGSSDVSHLTPLLLPVNRFLRDGRRGKLFVVLLGINGVGYIGTGIVVEISLMTSLIFVLRQLHGAVSLSLAFQENMKNIFNSISGVVRCCNSKLA